MVNEMNGRGGHKGRERIKKEPKDQLEVIKGI